MAVFLELAQLFVESVDIVLLALDVIQSFLDTLLEEGDLTILLLLLVLKLFQLVAEDLILLFSVEDIDLDT